MVEDQEAMRAFKPEWIPVTVTLSQEFAVFNKWFASMPCSTQPNRFYVHSATSHGLISNVTVDLVEDNPQSTIFQNIQDEGLTFGIYYQNIPSTLYFLQLRQLQYINNFKSYDLDFKKDAAAGTLPSYTVIKQRYFDLALLPANDNHPPHDVANGEKLLKEVYETLRQSPQWNEMVWIITYDEPGGFYNHVPTPVTGVPNPDGIKGPAPEYFNFDRLGVRVPTIVVSPWIDKGVVVHQATGPTSTSQYEHSSICATVKKVFNRPNFLTARDAWAGTFEGVFTTRTTPRTDCPMTLPAAPSSTVTTTTTTTTAATKSLDIKSKPKVQKEIKSFSKDGFVHLKGLLSEDELKGLEEEYMAFLRREVPVEGRDFCDMSAAYSKPLEEFSIINILLPSKYRPYLRGSLYEKRAASIAEQLQGANMVFDYDQLLAKVPKKPDGVFHWHQDLAYWPVTRDTRTASFWLAIDDSSMENGCIQFVPGSLPLVPLFWN